MGTVMESIIVPMSTVNNSSKIRHALICVVDNKNKQVRKSV